MPTRISRRSRRCEVTLSESGVGLCTARVLLAGDAEATEEKHMAGGAYTGLLTVLNVPKLHTL